ncbi:MAG: hypothetical protein KKH04_12020 [Proteobacteria bacterium]|nr:hypothetical protein [Pseudomonadota bacterium]
MNLPIIFALLVMGFTFTTTQVMVIRELLVVFVGNELSIAIILSNWLLLEAAGSYLIGRKVQELGWGRSGYAILQTVLSLLLPLTIYGVRCLRDMMGLPLGEGVSLLAIFFWTVPLLAPLGMVDGTLFALGCGLYAEGVKKSPSTIGRVYLCEALGAGGGGILYTFLFIPFFTSFQVAFLLGAANLISALLLMATMKRKTPGRHKFLCGLLGSLLLTNLLLLISPGARMIEKISLDRQWRGIKVVESRWSPYGNVTVGQREEQFTFFSNGLPIGNAPVPDISLVEEKVHFPLLFIPSPRKILIISGGFGGVITEVLKHPVEEVHYTEIDPLMIQMVRDNPLTAHELENPRLKVHSFDGRLFLKTTTQKFDGILLNLPPPSTLEINRFYTVEFFREIFNRLNEKGVLSFSLPGSETYLIPELRNLNWSLIKSLQQVFPSIYVVPGRVNIFLAFPRKDVPPLLPDLLISPLRHRKINTHFLTEYQIQLKLQTQRIKWLERSLLRGEAVRLNRDIQPVGLYYGLAYWNAQFHPFLQIFWGKLVKLRFGHIALPLGLTAIFLLLLGRVLRSKLADGLKDPILVWMVITTGFFGTSFSILLILSFQTLYGYAYQWTGLFIAIFMAGLAGGSWQMTRAVEKIRPLTQTLLRIEILFIGFIILGLFLMVFFYSPSGHGYLQAIRIGLLLLSGMAGFLVGLEFPLASCLFSASRERVGRAAGILYAADLGGAWAGSLFIGVLLIPVLGILPTLGVILLLKLTSLSLILTLPR